MNLARTCAALLSVLLFVALPSACSSDGSDESNDAGLIGVDGGGETDPGTSPTDVADASAGEDAPAIDPGSTTPQEATPCAACSTDDPCAGDALCVAAESGGDGQCALPCAGLEDACPAGFECQPSAIVGSPDPRFGCVPENDAPCCGPGTRGVETLCVQSNHAGVCEGLRVCLGADGWSPCGAPAATAEICDDLDNDCDGETDEDQGVDCSCGDGECAIVAGESALTCPVDCRICGDGACSPGEDPGVCPEDCCGTGRGAGCGDGVCLGFRCGENPQTCPEDCGRPCGDGLCEAGETPEICPDDCARSVCGNSVCEPSDGGSNLCSNDCGPTCGNCVCEGGESFSECPVDCGFCGDGVCSTCGQLDERARCAADCEGLVASDNPRGAISVSTERVIFESGELSNGQHSTRDVVVRNTGTAVLQVRSIDVSAIYPEDDTTISLASPPTGVIGLAPAGQGAELGLAEELVLTLRYDRPDGRTRSAALRIEHDDAARGAVVVRVDVRPVEISLSAAPAALVFGHVPLGSFEERTVNILNQGGDAVKLLGAQIVGDRTFIASIDVADETQIILAGQRVDFSRSLNLQPQEGQSMVVRFQPTAVGPQRASLLVFAEGLPADAPLEVSLRAIQTDACIEVEPRVLDFGARRISTATTLSPVISVCGGAPVSIHSVRFAEGASEAFVLDTESFETTNENASTSWPSNQAPLVLPPGRSMTFSLRFQPTAVSPTEPDGTPLPETARLLIESDATADPIELEVSGSGTESDCPTAVITASPSDLEIAPQTTIMLSAGESIPAIGEIKEVRWSVSQPAGSASAFTPNDSAPNVRFEANHAGHYAFRLEVRDDAGWSCVAARRGFVVLPDRALHVQLTWETPNDPDQSDEGPAAGADLDLHFVHWTQTQETRSGEDLYPPAPHGDGLVEGYFSDRWDTFWFNSSHDWGVLNVVEDNPSLDRDDPDGAGPESLNLGVPEEDAEYKVGVHCWSDHGFGASTAKVELFIFGQLRSEVTSCPLHAFDMWEVGVIDGSTLELSHWRCNGPQTPADGAAWPTRPCGAPSMSGSGCADVIIHEYKPENFLIEFN